MTTMNTETAPPPDGTDSDATATLRSGEASVSAIGYIPLVEIAETVESGTLRGGRSS